MNNKFIKIKEAADMLGLTTARIYWLVNKDLIPYHQTPQTGKNSEGKRKAGRLLFDPEELRSWLNSRGPKLSEKTIKIIVNEIPVICKLSSTDFVTCAKDGNYEFKELQKISISEEMAITAVEYSFSKADSIGQYCYQIIENVGGLNSTRVIILFIAALKLENEEVKRIYSEFNTRIKQNAVNM